MALDAIAFACGFGRDEIRCKSRLYRIQALQNELYCGPERLHANSKYQENCVSQLTCRKSSTELIRSIFPWKFGGPRMIAPESKNIGRVSTSLA